MNASSNTPEPGFATFDRFQPLFEQHSAVKLIIDAETGRIVDANKAAAQFYGWPLEVLKKMSIQEINTLSPEAVEAEIMKGVRSESASFEFRHRRADGSIRDVEVFSNKIELMGKTSLYSIIHDITDRKRAEEALRHSEVLLQAANAELQEQNEELLRLWDKSRQTEDKLNRANQDLIRQAAEMEAINRQVNNDKRLQTAMMEALPIGVVITDKSGAVIHSNKACEAIWGGPRPENLSVQDFSYPKAWWADTGRPVAPEEWASAITIRECRTSVGQIMRIQRFDGSDAFIINSAAPVYDTDGNVAGSAMAIQDVTELKLAEQALQETKKDFVRAQEVGGIGSWRLDLRRDVLTWSDENYRIFGLPLGMPLKYETFLSCVHPDDRAHVDTQWNAGLRGEPYDIEHRIMVAGRTKWVREKAFLEFDKDGVPIGGFGITQDITERKQAEETLKKKHEEMQIILDSSPIMIFYKDRENRMIRVNKTLAEITGLSKEAVEGKTAFEIFPDQAQQYWIDDKEVIESGKSKNGIIEQIDGAAGIRWVQTDKVPYRDKDGNIIGIIGFAVDITALKQAEEQLQAINNELERRVEERTRELQETQKQYLHAEKLSAIGQLSASIAHEFNNPLQAVITILQSFKKWRELDEKDRKWLDLAISESIRMKILIRSLQDFNRPSSGSKKLMDVHAAIDSLLLLCKADLKRKGISTVLNYAKRLPQILAISDQIKQVILNLLNNAADACLQNGVITISTWHNDTKIAIAIKDNGIGIEPEKRDLIFQPFYTTKPAVKGTGLGLSVCHGIIQTHHGEIRVESLPGEGSTFTVLLPIIGDSDVATLDEGSELSMKG